jgi:hypothetical protein
MCSLIAVRDAHRCDKAITLTLRILKKDTHTEALWVRGRALFFSGFSFFLFFSILKQDTEALWVRGRALFLKSFFSGFPFFFLY